MIHVDYNGLKNGSNDYEQSIEKHN